MKDYLKVKQAVTTYRLATQKLDDITELKNEWIWGLPGAGKSRPTREKYKDSLYVKPLNKWWDGYDGEETVMLEDVGKEHQFLGYFLKIWGDHYPFTSEIKGYST